MRLDNLLNNSDEKAFWRRYNHLGDAYMASRRKAENVALDLAIQCQDEAHAALVPRVPMKTSKGSKFVAIGMYDVRYGVQFFALDYETATDRESVNEWIAEEPCKQP